MNKNYDYERDVKYCYPNSFVLKNKLNIISAEELELAERRITSLRLAEVYINPIKGDFDLQHLKNIHKHIFQDIYSWAGEIRTVNISKNSDMFYNHMYIADGANELFSKLKKENYLIGASHESICEKLAYYLGEINAMHPFREGNGRTQRILIEDLARVAGYDISFHNVSKDEMIEASIASHKCDYRKMMEIFTKIISPITPEQQKSFIKKIATPNSPVLKVYNEFIKKVLSEAKKVKAKGMGFDIDMC